jgi:hypothetical protein
LFMTCSIEYFKCFGKVKRLVAISIRSLFLSPISCKWLNTTANYSSDMFARASGVSSVAGLDPVDCDKLVAAR